MKRREDKVPVAREEKGNTGFFPGQSMKKKRVNCNLTKRAWEPIGTSSGGEITAAGEKRKQADKT